MSDQPDARMAFSEASAFHRATNIICLAIQRDMGQDPRVADLVFPQYVNAAYAAEAYLKCLIALRFNRLQKGHHLKVLFDELPPKDQSELITRHAQLCVANPKKQEGWAHTGRLPQFLPFVLQEANNAFVDLRYTFEGVSIAGIGELMDVDNALRQHILAEHPEWREAMIWIVSSPDPSPPVPEESQTPVEEPLTARDGLAG
jgi:hypothetical protein